MSMRTQRLGNRLVKLASDTVLKRPFIFPIGIYLCLTFIQQILTNTWVRDFLLYSILVLLAKQVTRWRGIYLSSFLLFLYGSLIAASVTWNVYDPGEFSIPGMMAIVTLAAFLANHHYTEQDLRDARNMFFFGGVATSLYMLFQYYFGEALIIDDRLVLGTPTNHEDPNTLCAYLTMSLAAGFQIIVASKSTTRRLFAVLCTGAVVVIMMLTGSRSGFVGMSVAFAVFVLGSNLARKHKVTIIVVAFLSLPYLPGFSGVMERFNSADSSGSGRIYIWNVAIYRFKEKFFLGHGAESFGYLYYELGKTKIKAVHSTQLTTLVEQGIVGFSLLMFITLFISLKGYLNLSRTKGVWLLAAFTSFYVQSMFLSLLQTRAFWLVLGLFAGAAQHRIQVLKRNRRSYVYDGASMQRSARKRMPSLGGRDPSAA